MNSIDGKIRGWLGCLLILAIAHHFSLAQSPVVSNPKISGAISFRCLWWSDEQKNGLNPNSPPPKTTEIAIEKWEYSDPIEVPHPDVVDLVVDLRNDSNELAQNLTVIFSVRWQVGPLKNKSRAIWGKAIRLKSMTVSKLDAQSAQTLRVPVNIEEKMKRLFAHGSWPWTLRARVTISGASGRVLHKFESELPIIPGD
jgi:hypothetical protein